MAVTWRRVAAGTGASAAGMALAVTLIQHWEGFDPVAKHNSFDPAGVITVCNGVTNYDLPTLKAGDTFTKAECEKMLLDFLPKYGVPLSKCVPGLAQMPPHRQGSLLSASWNLGVGTICKSTAVRLINAGKIKDGCEALERFVMANGKFLKGLFNRRTDGQWGEIGWCKRSD